MKQAIFFILMLLVCSTVFAIDTWQAYTCPYQVKDICDDGAFVWLATSGGLVKVEKATGDHEIFNSANSGLSTNFLTSVNKDAAGNLWVGASMGIVDDSNNFDSSGGVHVWHTDDTWTHYTTLNSPLPSNLISDIEFDSQGNTWIGNYRGGVCKRAADGTWEVLCMQNTVLNSDKVGALAVTADDRVWIGLMDYWNGTNNVGGGLACYEDNTIVDYTSLLNQANSHDVQDLYVDESGVLWIAAVYGTYYSFDGSEMTHYEIPDLGMGISNPAVYAITAKNGAVYMGTSCGLTIYDNGSWQQFNDTNSVMGEYNLASVCIDSDDVVWCGSSFWGLFRFEDSLVSEYSILDDSTTLGCPYIDDIAIAEDNSVWLANGYNLINNGIGGLVHFDGEDQWELYDYPVTDDFVYGDVCIDNGVVYVASGTAVDIGGVLVYDNGDWTRYDYYTTNGGFPYVCADDVAVGGNGLLYASRCDADGGIAVFDGSEWHVFNSSNSGLVSNLIYCLAADPVEDNVLWVGTKYGLMKMEYGTTTNFTLYHPGNTPLGSAEIVSLAFDGHDTLWVGTLVGAASFDGVSWISYDALLPGMPFTGAVTCVNDIAFDEYERVWFATDYGLHIFDGEDVTAFTTENSPLPVNAIRQLAIDQNGKAYIGTFGCGLYVAEYSSPVSVEEPIVGCVPAIAHRNYPNPFNPETTISFTLPAEGDVRVDVYNLKGQKVQRLLSDTLGSGEHCIQWNGQDEEGKAVASGTYFYRIQYNNASYTRKMVLLK
jgi:ligand-binding sensor domain-containing protein